MTNESQHDPQAGPRGGPPGGTRDGRQARGLRAVATQLNRVTAAVRRRRGLTEAGLFADWAAIVGAGLAAECAPQRLVRGADGAGGTLHVRVTGPLALELQHLEPLVIERINGFFGYRAVARLVLHQGPLAPRDARPARAKPVPDARIEAQLAPMLAGVEDEALRDALSRLGREVLARQATRRSDGEDSKGQETAFRS
jgi:hypothetical protein